jgi:hypothetical protein
MKIKDLVSTTFSTVNSVTFVVTKDQVADYNSDPNNCENVITFTSDYKCELILNDKISNAEVKEIAVPSTDLIVIRIEGEI